MNSCLWTYHLPTLCTLNISNSSIITHKLKILILCVLDCGLKCSMWPPLGLELSSGSKWARTWCRSTSPVLEMTRSWCSTSPPTTVKWIRYWMFDLCSQVRSVETNKGFAFYIFSRDSYWTSQWMFCVLERPIYKWYLGIKLYLANRCQTISRVLREYYWH